MMIIGCVRMMSITVCPPNFRKMVRADDRVVVAAPHISYSRFELNQIVDVRSTFSRPVHAADNAAEQKSSLGAAAGQLLKRFQHPILIETPVPKVCFRVRAKLQLPTLLRCRRVDPHRCQALQVVVVLTRINDANRLVATL